MKLQNAPLGYSLFRSHDEGTVFERAGGGVVFQYTKAHMQSLRQTEETLQEVVRCSCADYNKLVTFYILVITVRISTPRVSCRLPFDDK